MKNPDTLETLDGKHRTKTNKTIDTKHDTVAACMDPSKKQANKQKTKLRCICSLTANCTRSSLGNKR